MNDTYYENYTDEELINLVETEGGTRLELELIDRLSRALDLVSDYVEPEDVADLLEAA